MCNQAGAQVRVVVLLQRHQQADDLSADEGIVKALLRHRPQGEAAVDLQSSRRVRWFQQLHKLNVGIVDLGRQSDSSTSSEVDYTTKYQTSAKSFFESLSLTNLGLKTCK